MFDKEFPDLPGLNPKINPKKGLKHQVTIAITHEQINELKEKFDINTMSMIDNAIRNEVYINISKLISDLVFKKAEKKLDEKNETTFSYKIPKIKPYKLDWNLINGKILNLLTMHYYCPSRASSSLSLSWEDDIKKRNAFIIANAKIGILLKQQNDFKAINLKTLNYTRGLHKIGSFFNKITSYQPLDIYINPYLEFEDNKIAIISENFWNWKEIAPLIIVEKNMAPKRIFKIKFNNKKADSDVYELINYEDSL